MTTRKALYLATITDGVVEYEGPASDEDVESFGWVRIERAYAASLAHAMKQEALTQGVCTLPLTSDSSPTLATLGGMLSGPPVAPDVLPVKEANGSNGHGEAGVAELPDLEIYGSIAKGPRKLPSERIAELVTQGPTANQLGTVGWALDVIGRVMDERAER